jgi:NADPH:quinone reductase
VVNRQCRPPRRAPRRVQFRPARRRISTIGVTFRTRSIDESREIFNEVRKDIWGAVESRKLQLPIDKVYKFDEIGQAFAHMEANKHLGKIVVTL